MGDGADDIGRRRCGRYFLLLHPQLDEVGVDTLHTVYCIIFSSFKTREEYVQNFYRHVVPLLEVVPDLARLYTSTVPLVVPVFSSNYLISIYYCNKCTICRRSTREGALRIYY
jgi:hypothetical protein